MYGGMCLLFLQYHYICTRVQLFWHTLILATFRFVEENCFIPVFSLQTKIKIDKQDSIM